MNKRMWPLPALLIALVAFGCIEREGRPVNPCTNVTIGQAIQVNNVDKVDLLFMVDNSNSMEQEQASLTAEFPRMIQVLTSGDFELDGALDGPDDFDPVRDLNVGVITSDMGTGGFTVPTCARSDFGDDGILRTEGRTDIPGCMATYPSFLNYQPATATETPAEFGARVSCVASVGIAGCGFEQQLEAILKALSPSAATSWTAEGYVAPSFFRNTFGHADGNNDGFVRDNSVLAVIPVTDEEDCSAQDPELFNPMSSRYGATDLNLRCFAHGEALHPISRFVDGLIQLRRSAGLLIYAPIVGIPVDLAPGPGESPNYPLLVSEDFAVRDDRMEEMIDPAEGNRLIPSCDVLGRGQAFPPIRIVRVAEQLEQRGAGVTVQSICQESFQGALTEIIRQIKSALGAACLPRQLQTEADGTVACDVVTLMPSGQDCSVIPGAEPQLENGVPVVENGRNVCVLPQLVPSGAERGGGTPPAGNGWYYDNYTIEGADNCQQGAGSPYQRIAFTAQPPSGAEVRLECFQSVQGTGEGTVGIGTFCEPDADTVCATGMAPDMSTALSCDRNTRACGVPCAAGGDADCRDAGLVGFVCDRRPLGEVNPEQFSSTEFAMTPYNFCVNPTCGS